MFDVLQGFPSEIVFWSGVTVGAVTGAVAMLIGILVYVYSGDDQ